LFHEFQNQIKPDALPSLQLLHIHIWYRSRSELAEMKFSLAPSPFHASPLTPPHCPMQHLSIPPILHPSFANI
jgi:hypothetical protein